MTSVELKNLFSRYAEDAQFTQWNKNRSGCVRFVYACEDGEVWKFTPKAWWQFVTKTVHSAVDHDFSAVKALGHRPAHITKGAGDLCNSADTTVRCVNTLDWTMENWSSELK